MTKRLITTLNRGLYRFHNNLMVRQTRQDKKRTIFDFFHYYPNIFSYYILCYSQIVCFGLSRGHSNIQSADQETSFISAAAIKFFNNCGVLSKHPVKPGDRKLFEIVKSSLSRRSYLKVLQYFKETDEKR